MSIRDLTPPRRITWRGGPQPPAGDLPPITLITPCLNRAGLVGMAVESAWAQGYPALRHIVIDGGSTDGTLDVLARYPDVEVVAQGSRGSHPAMNEGLARADGEVIAFLNTDDLLLPGALHAAGRAFADDPALDALRFRAALFGAIDGDIIPAHGEIVDPPADRHLDALLFGTPGFNAWFFRRRVFDRHGHFDPAFDIGADRDFLIRLHLGHARVRHLSSLGYAYRQHAGSRTLDRAATLRLRILAEHVTIARKLLARRDLESADRTALAAWHAYEMARLSWQHVKSARVGDALALLGHGFSADPGWLMAVAGGRRRAAAIAAAVRSAGPAGSPTPA